MDSMQEHMLIYAKDSLLKVINFSSTLGKQELIKHLTKEKSYLLLETTKGKYAIRTNYTKYQDTTLSYSFKKKLGSKRIAGMKAKKLSVTFTDIDKKFTFYYLKNIPAIYGSAYTNFPGLVDLDKKQIFDSIQYQLDHGRFDDYIQNTIAGGKTFQSSQHYVNYIKTIL
jgi:hypothetical protein